MATHLPWLLEDRNAFLEGFALLNDGVNHTSSNTIESLPIAASLAESLDLPISATSTADASPQPVAAWQIRATRVEVTPPMWYECAREGVAIDEAEARWLAHSGFLD